MFEKALKKSPFSYDATRRVVWGEDHGVGYGSGQNKAEAIPSKSFDKEMCHGEDKKKKY